MFEAVTISLWLEGQHRGKEQRICGGVRYATEEEALEKGRLYNPVGNIYRHGATGNRHKVLRHTTKKVRNPRN